MKTIDNEELKMIVKSIIPTKYPFWILLSNGTFLVLEEDIAMKQRNLKKWATELLEELHEQRLTVFAFVDDIVCVPDFGGWIVTNRYGAYTYVHPSEFSDADPSELAISVKGCYKFQQDCAEKNFLHLQAPRSSSVIGA